MRFMRIVGALVAVLLLVAGCNRDEEDPSLKTAAPAAEAAVNTDTTAGTQEATGVTGSADTTSGTSTAPTDADESTTTATTRVVSGLPTYEVIHELIEDDRETLVIVVEPGTYSNVELENLVYDVVERFSPSVAIVVDDRAAADLAILDERTEDEQRELDAHTFLRIENGVEVTFFGPYADFPELTVGS